MHVRAARKRLHKRAYKTPIYFGVVEECAAPSHGNCSGVQGVAIHTQAGQLYSSLPHFGENDSVSPSGLLTDDTDRPHVGDYSANVFTMNR